MALIQGVHTGLAYFGGPHWLIDDADALRYAQACANVARHYDFEVAQKTIDWLNLCGLVAYFEGTRLLAQRNPQRAAGGGRPPQPRPPGTVVPIFQFGNPPAAGNPSPAQPQPEPFGPPYPPQPDDSPPEGQLH